MPTKHYITDAVNIAYKDSLKYLFSDMGVTITIYVNAGRNPAIPLEDWDVEGDQPLDYTEYPDKDDWYTFTEYSILNVVAIYPSNEMIMFSAGAFSAQDVILYCKLEDILVDPASQNGSTYFDLDDLAYVNVDGYDYIKKGVTKKMGLRGADKYVCEILLTRKTE